MATTTHVPLTRRYAIVVAAADLGAGVTGAVIPVSHFQTPTYQPATRFFSWLPGWPSTWWTWLLIIIAALALVGIASHNDRLTRHCFTALCGYWTFWVILYVAAWANPGSGPWGPWLAGIAVIGNSRPVIAPTLTD